MHFLIVLFFAHSNHNSKMINKNVFNQNIHAKQAVDTDKHRPLFVRFYCGVIGGLSHSLSLALSFHSSLCNLTIRLFSTNEQCTTKNALHKTDSMIDCYAHICEHVECVKQIDTNAF